MCAPLGQQGLNLRLQIARLGNASFCRFKCTMSLHSLAPKRPICPPPARYSAIPLLPLTAHIPAAVTSYTTASRVVLRFMEAACFLSLWISVSRNAFASVSVRVVVSI